MRVLEKNNRAKAVDGQHTHAVVHKLNDKIIE